MLAIYWLTLCPTVSLEYSGQLIVAADHLGVAREPGYPVWTLLAKLFIILCPWAGFRGHPNPAWAVNFLSAVCGALACGVLALMVSACARQVSKSTAGLRALPVAISAALVFGLSPAMWSQAVIAETHALSIFYLLAFLALLLAWIPTQSPALGLWIAFLLGFGLAVSPLFILLVPVVWWAAFLVSNKNGIQFIAATSVWLLFIYLEYQVGVRGLLRAAAILDLMVVLVLVALLFRWSRRVGWLLVLLLLGLLPYAYLPLAAGHHPPMNMGRACTWEGFWYVMTRGHYERMVFMNPFTHAALFGLQVRWFLRLLVSQFTLPVVLLGLIPWVCMRTMVVGLRRGIGLVGLAFFIFSILVLIGANPTLDLQTQFLARVLFIPAFALWTLLVGCGLALLLHGAAHIWNPRADG